jgi:predicted acyltransferase
VLFTSGLAAMILGACHKWLDHADVTLRQVLQPFVVLGRNALTLFVVSGLLVKTLALIKIAGANGTSVSLYTWLYQRVFAPWATPKNASLFFALTALFALYFLLELMYRRRWFLRV